MSLKIGIKLNGTEQIQVDFDDVNLFVENISERKM
jgi:hypothetical protein